MTLRTLSIRNSCIPQLCSVMIRLPIHNALKSLAWLEGTWRTEIPGEGKYPTISPFQYHEEIKFSSIGQPMLNYEAQSWHFEKKNPMHREVGFLKVVPGTNKVVFILSHNFGLTTIEEGVIDNNCITLNTASITRVPSSKDPAVVKVKREFKKNENNLEQTIYMATSTTPELTEHLHAIYIKQTPET